jgi:hypothetical protein
MPSTFLTEHRQRFSDFQTHLNHEQYLFFSGQKTRLEANALTAEYSDLFSLATRTELQQELDAARRDTDRAAIQLLLTNASQAYLKSSVRVLTNEIADYEARATIVWEGETITFADASSRLRTESNPVRRHDLAARRAEIIKGSQDLRAERLQTLHDAARRLGAENYLALYRQQRGIEYEMLATQLPPFLVQTESLYAAGLAAALLREANVTLAEATHADLPHFRSLARFDKFFPAWQLKHAYRETFSGLGILTYQQSNLVIDDEPRPRKTTKSFHFPVRVPDEIKVLVAAQDGARRYEAWLHECGRAQQFAWTSRQLYPEFQYSGDGAVREVFGLLFAGLLQDERWLGEMLSYYESHEFRHLLAVQKLLLLRCNAARLQYEIELHAGHLAGKAGTRYAELLTDAVRVDYDETEHLRAVADGMIVADYLRAAAFEAQLREQLKTKFGSRWWTSRKAGDYLIDLWNTGGRYPAEEMAKLIDLGALSFDWLAEESLMNLHP